jgi:hypothetical protein
MVMTPKRLGHLARDLAARSDQDITAAIQQYDPETKIAVRHAIDLQREARGIEAKADELPSRRLGEQNGSYFLRRLNVHGPIDLKTLEAKMTELEPGVRMEIKCTAMERGWLSQGLGYRVSAGSERENQAPLSVEMRALYRRVGLEADGSYAQGDIDERLGTSDLSVTQKMAIRGELALRQQLRASGVDTLAEKLTALHALQRRLQRL